MARKQQRLPGMENDGVPEDLENAGEKYLELKREKRRLGEKVKESRAAVLLLMKTHKVEIYAVKDEETGETIELETETEVKLKTRRTAEADDIEVGEGIASVPPSDGPHPGLIAEAERASDGTNAVVDPEGDVVPKDEAAPKKKRGKRKAKK